MPRYVWVMTVPDGAGRRPVRVFATEALAEAWAAANPAAAAGASWEPLPFDESR